MELQKRLTILHKKTSTILLMFYRKPILNHCFKVAQQGLRPTVPDMQLDCYHRFNQFASLLSEITRSRVNTLIISHYLKNVK